MKHRTFIFTSEAGAQVAVDLYADGVDVKVRPDSSAVWGLPLTAVSESGDPVQIAFEGES